MSNLIYSRMSGVKSDGINEIYTYLIVKLKFILIEIMIWMNYQNSEFNCFI